MESTTMKGQLGVVATPLHRRIGALSRATCAAGLAVTLLLIGTTARAATVKAAPYGTTKDGRIVTAYTLTNDKGASATILDYGGTVAAIRVPDRDGKLGNVVMSFADMSGWESIAWANSLVGRVANRITNGFTLEGVRYPLQQTGPQGMTMHSGPQYYGTRIWTVAPIKPRDGASIKLSLFSPDGDQGFPGTVRVNATYRLTNDNALRLDLSATTDKATPINLTNHLYFNLSGNSTVPVYDHDLQVMTDRVANADVGGETKGPFALVAGTPYDFTKPTPLKERLALALGPEFGNPATSPPLPAGMARNFNIAFWLRGGDNRLDRVAVRLHDPLSGRVLEVRTTEISPHVYTQPLIRGDYLSDAGKPFTRVPAIAIETQHLPDSPNRPDFPSVVLRPGQMFRSTTIFSFTTDGTTRQTR
jgi:aldose 1-epimerase